MKHKPCSEKALDYLRKKYPLEMNANKTEIEQDEYWITLGDCRKAIQIASCKCSER